MLFFFRIPQSHGVVIAVVAMADGVAIVAVAAIAAAAMADGVAIVAVAAIAAVAMADGVAIDAVAAIAAVAMAGGVAITAVAWLTVLPLLLLPFVAFGLAFDDAVSSAVGALMLLFLVLCSINVKYRYCCKETWCVLLPSSQRMKPESSSLPVLWQRSATA